MISERRPRAESRAPMGHIGRKLFHLLGGLGLLSLYFLLGRDRVFFVYAVLAAAVLALEIARLTIPAWNRFLYEHFGSFIRKNEERKLTGTVPYVFGIALSLYFYSLQVACAAVCFSPSATLRPRRSVSGTGKGRSAIRVWKGPLLLYRRRLPRASPFPCSV